MDPVCLRTQRPNCSTGLVQMEISHLPHHPHLGAHPCPDRLAGGWPLPLGRWLAASASDPRRGAVGGGEKHGGRWWATVHPGVHRLEKPRKMGCCLEIQYLDGFLGWWKAPNF